MSDHPLTNTSAMFDVYFSAKVDDIIAVSKYTNFKLLLQVLVLIETI